MDLEKMNLESIRERAFDANAKPEELAMLFLHEVGSVRSNIDMIRFVEIFLSNQCKMDKEIIRKAIAAIDYHWNFEIHNTPGSKALQIVVPFPSLLVQNDDQGVKMKKCTPVDYL